MTMITPSYLGETIEYSSLHACRSTLEDPTVYPFPLRDRLMLFSWVVVIAAVAMNIAVLVSMNRDRILSMLSGTTPGKLNWDGHFLMQLLIFGVIPVLSLLGIQFPKPIQSVLAWISGAGSTSGSS